MTQRALLSAGWSHGIPNCRVCSNGLLGGYFADGFGAGQLPRDFSHSSGCTSRRTGLRGSALAVSMGALARLVAATRSG
jgi:hypothetical protein